MAVYKRTYTRYDGPLTPERWRFAILPRYSIQSVFEMRFSYIALVLALVPHLIALALIYLRSNVDALVALDFREARELELLTVNGSFFLVLFYVETFISFFVVALLGPGLISPDLANNAMPLYLSRPFSRTEYVAGKLTVLLALTSCITWIPGLLLFGVQTSIAGFSWFQDNFNVLVGIVVGSWIWTLTISLIALALSAWVRWKTIAAASLFGIFFVSAGFGTISNVILVTTWGTLLNLAASMNMIWRWFLLGETAHRISMPPFTTLPSWTGLLPLAAVCGIALLLLNRKIRAAQVVR